MRDQIALEVVAGGMLALLLSAASSAAAEPASQTGREPLMEFSALAPSSELEFAPPSESPAGVAALLRRWSPERREKLILRYERPLHVSDTDMLLRIRTLKSQRKLVVVELRF